MFVSAIGEVSRPLSRIHSRPVKSPQPLRVWQPANSGLHGDLALVRDDRRDACAHRPLAHHERPGLALDERHAADADAGHVGDGVEPARTPQADVDPEFPGPHQASSARSERRRFSTHHTSTPATTTTAMLTPTIVPALPPPSASVAAVFGPTLR